MCFQVFRLSLLASAAMLQVAMEELAAAVPAEHLGREAYKLYERFRPEWRGWGQAGQLDPQKLHQLAESWQQEA